MSYPQTTCEFLRGKRLQQRKLKIQPSWNLVEVCEESLSMSETYICHNCGATPDKRKVEGKLDLEIDVGDMLFDLDYDPGLIYERHAWAVLTIPLPC